MLDHDLGISFCSVAWEATWAVGRLGGCCIHASVLGLLGGWEALLECLLCLGYFLFW
jgi:hypothetical protein